MNEKDQELEGLSLEDILKEFGNGDSVTSSEAEEAVPIVPDEPIEEPEETDETPQSEEIPEEEPAEELPEEAEEAAEAEDEAEEASEETTEGFQEMSEFGYAPQEPIVFRPRSRLRELKRKLIAGPEKRYYELSEMGLGKLQIAIAVCLLVVGLSAGGAAMYAFEMIPENRMRLMVFCQILVMLIGALLSYNQLLDGIGDLFRGKFTLNTMLFITLIACVVDGVFCLKEQRVPLCAAFTLEAAMALWAAYQRRNTEMGQMDTMRKATRLDSVVRAEDYYNGRPAFLRGEGQVEDFMDRYNEPSVPEKRQNRYALVCLLLSIAIAVVAGVFHSVSMAFRIFSTTLLVAVPASFFVATTRPMSVLERRLHSLGTVLCGWDGVKGLSTRAAYPLNDQDIFPAGSVKLNGVKFYGDRDPDVTVAYATALICANGGSLVPIFQQLLESRTGPKYPVKEFHTYTAGGIGGEICGEEVIMGSLKFLQDMGVEVPAGMMVNQAVYVSINGAFSGLFAINYTRMKYSANGLGTICAYRGLTPVITAEDFMLTPAFLKEKFGVNTRRMVYPTREEKDILAQITPAEDAPALALTTHEGLAPAAYAVTGARALRTACRLGLIIHIVGGMMGMLVMLAVAILGAVELLTPLNILLYQLIWMIPGLLATEWTRAI